MAPSSAVVRQLRVVMAVRRLRSAMQALATRQVEYHLVGAEHLGLTAEIELAREEVEIASQALVLLLAEIQPEALGGAWIYETP